MKILNNSSKNYVNNEPHLQEDIFICPNKVCGNTIKGLLTNLQIKNYENKSLLCEKCGCNYKFILCLHCKRKIFTNSDENLFGSNIKCPHKDCLQDFFVINCPECDELLNIKKIILDNDKIKCEYCKKESILIRCPNNICKFLNFFSNDNNDKINISLLNRRIKCSKCNKDFIKFNCPKCHESLYTLSYDYLEGCEIQCKNKKCHSKFKMFSCPSCFEDKIVNEKSENWENNQVMIHCENVNCKTIYSKVNCPKCSTEVLKISKNRTLEGKNIKCVLESCNNIYSYTSCRFCGNSNFWMSKYEINLPEKKLLDRVNNNLTMKDTFIVGQPVICLNCNIKSTKINCPFCNNSINFYDSNLEYGKTYKCTNLKCEKEFYLNFCPECLASKTCKNPRNRFEFLQCPNSSKSEKIGLLSKKCPEKYDFIKCLNCDTVSYFYDCDFNKYKALKCPKSDCSMKFIIYNCLECCERITIAEMLLGKILYSQCKNSRCKKNFTLIYCDDCFYFFTFNFCEEEFGNLKNTRKQLNICFNKNCKKYNPLDKIFKEDRIISKDSIFCHDPLKNFNNETGENILTTVTFDNGYKRGTPDYSIDYSQKELTNLLSTSLSPNLIRFYSNQEYFKESKFKFLYIIF